MAGIVNDALAVGAPPGLRVRNRLDRCRRVVLLQVAACCGPQWEMLQGHGDTNEACVLLWLELHLPRFRTALPAK